MEWDEIGNVTRGNVTLKVFLCSVQNSTISLGRWRHQTVNATCSLLQ